jgi:type IV pilus assembly protein PilA
MLKKLGSKLKEQKGFTLIELLAVIVILGIIAAIAIPAINNVINKSEAKSHAQEGVQIINAAKMYVANETATKVNFVSNVATLSKTQLMTYLDRVDANDDTKYPFTVVVTKDATTGNYSYVLTDHTSTAKAPGDKLDEQALINAAK